MVHDKRCRDSDLLERPTKPKKQRITSPDKSTSCAGTGTEVSKFSGCFSFCIYNNALYDVRDDSKYFEKRYLNGLLTNIKMINKLERRWKIVIYADNHLQHYYSIFHKKQFVDLLSDYDNIIIHWVVNKYIKNVAFALERFRPIANEEYSIVVVRDVDQLITDLDISYIDNLIESDQNDTLCYCVSEMTFISGGGGFATKKTGQSYINDEEARHMYLPRYISDHYTDGVGYEEYWITHCHEKNKIDLGNIYTVLTKFVEGSWYVDGKELLSYDGP